MESNECWVDKKILFGSSNIRPGNQSSSSGSITPTCSPSCRISGVSALYMFNDEYLRDWSGPVYKRVEKSLVCLSSVISVLIIFIATSSWIVSFFIFTSIHAYFSSFGITLFNKKNVLLDVAKSNDDHPMQFLPGMSFDEWKLPLCRDTGDGYGQAASNLVAGSALEETVQQIIDMGGGTWDRDTVLRALRAAFNNPERAVEYLYSVSISFECVVTWT